MLPMALSLLETMPGGALLTDPAGRIAGINGIARRIFRLKARDAIGAAVTSLIPDSQWQNIIRTGLPSGAHRFCVDDTVYVRVELPVFADGRVVAVLAHFLSRETGILREILTKMPGAEGLAVETELLDEPPASEPAKLERVQYTLADVRGNSRAIREARTLAGRAARTDMPVLIVGEAGTEIDHFARAIHSASSRAAAEFVTVNCRSAAESLLEAELFGQSGGPGPQRGKVDEAEGGTLYLEDIGEMPMAIQARMIRAMQAASTSHGGATGYRVRFIASSHRDLATLVAAGRFREDLYYRLNVIRLEIPPLRARPEDIRALVDHHLGHLNQLYANQGWNKRIASDGMEVLLRYSWPGNVAELASVMARAYCMSEGEEIETRHLPSALQQIGKVPTEVVGQKTLDEIVAEVERGVIIEALRLTGQNKSRTAKLLGLPRSSFYEKLARYGLMSDDKDD